MIDIKELENKIINADCMDILKELPDKCIDLVLTDPPYGINIGNGLGSGKKTCKMHHDWQFNTPKQDFFDELFRVSKEQIIWGGNYFNLPICDDWIIWDKLNPNLSFAEAELAWCSVHRKIRIFKHYSAKVDGGSKIHPTQKPVVLFEWCLQKYSNENDLVLDCFSGSGTTAIACHRLNRRFICIEKDKDYWEAPVKRIKDEQSQLTLDLF